MQTYTSTAVRLTDATTAAIDTVLTRAVNHYEGVTALFIEHILPTITVDETSVNADGDPILQRTVDPAVWTATLTATFEGYLKRAADVGLEPATAKANIRQYRRRIIARVTRDGITVPGAEAEQDAAATAQSATSAENAAAEALVATGDPITGVVDALQYERWSEARAIIRAMQKAANAKNR